jgi:glycosyltransferase involved in cell wall biosynthesis
MPPLISVVIPVWNRPEFLSLSVESVLAQSYQNFELIIVDDGSTDHTFSVAQELSRIYSRIRLIRKDHTGAADSINQGIKAMRGSVFCLLGSDDLWLPTKLKEQVELHKKFPDHILHTEAIHINVDGDHLSFSNLLEELGGEEPEWFLERHKQWMYAAFFGSSLFIPLTILSKVGYFSDNICQDYHWVLKAALLFEIPFTLLPKHLMKKRNNPVSITGVNRDYISTEAKRIWSEVLMEIK